MILAILAVIMASRIYDGKGFRILPWREATAAIANCKPVPPRAEVGVANSAENLGRPANDTCALWMWGV